nr:MAG TPA: hypothetical protein [Caudoviricetes sp.]DAM37459.1 MAG TPA: hypothetical protein [Caudoviricetes sp.]
MTNCVFGCNHDFHHFSGHILSLHKQHVIICATCKRYWISYPAKTICIRVICKSPLYQLSACILFIVVVP